jgi:hypothetical protein
MLDRGFLDSVITIVTNIVNLPLIVFPLESLYKTQYFEVKPLAYPEEAALSDPDHYRSD